MIGNECLNTKDCTTLSFIASSGYDSSAENKKSKWRYTREKLNFSSLKYQSYTFNTTIKKVEKNIKMRNNAKII